MRKPNNKKVLDRKVNAGVKIRMWMLGAGVKASQIAKELEVDYSAITHFLNGKLTSQRIRNHFVEKGCPEKLLERLNAA